MALRVLTRLRRPLTHLAAVNDETATKADHTRSTPLVKWAPSALSPTPETRSASAVTQTAPASGYHSPGVRRLVVRPGAVPRRPGAHDTGYEGQAGKQHGKGVAAGHGVEGPGG